MKIELTSALALIAAALASPASAQRGPETLVVRTNDLDLARPADRAILDRRLKRAARMVCHNHTIDPPVEVVSLGRCQRDTLAEARALVAPRLAASLAYGGRRAKPRQPGS